MIIVLEIPNIIKMGIKPESIYLKQTKYFVSVIPLPGVILDQLNKTAMLTTTIKINFINKIDYGQ